jgi:hypothetical protein
MSREASRIAGGIPGRPMLWLLGVLPTLVSALAFAVAVQVTSGELHFDVGGVGQRRDCLRPCVSAQPVQVASKAE